ncbi:MAG: tripartite tricarboxylate transporter TctB family protein [Gammaproteobacteria bacterium]
MGNLRAGHLVEAGLWLALCLVLFIYSFEFNQNIEIYKFGASAWPRAIILLIAIAAVGQLYHHWKRGDESTSEVIGAATDDGSEEAAHEAHHSDFKWYLSTFGLLVIPFVYLHLPGWVVALVSAEGMSVHVIKIICAAILIGIFMFYMRRNILGAMLSLPLMFAVLMEDMGFYSLAPFFIIGVMFMMGERKAKPMVLVAALIFGLLLLLFVKILYVGLPVGNIHPFYDIGSWVVTVLQ